MSLPEYSRILPEIALDYSDVILEPAASTVSIKDVDLKTRISRGIPLNVPFAVYVTDAEQAIAAAQFGSIGIIPCTSAVSKQADIVRKVKRFQSHVVRQPITLTAESSIVEALEVQQRYGLDVIPVVENGTQVLKGYLVLDDKISYDDVEKTVSDFLSDRETVTMPAGSERSDAYELMKETKAEYIALIDDHSRLAALITREDKENIERYPAATMDENGRLRVIACVGTGEEHYDRVSALIDAGVDAIYIDAAHGHSKSVLDMVTYIRRQRSGHVDVIAGNVVTNEGALALIDAGADAVKVGQQIPQITAILQVGDATSLHNIPAVAVVPGKFSDAVKAFATGASVLLIELSDQKIGDFSKSLEEKLRLGMSETGCANIREFNLRPRFIRVAK